MYVEARPRRRIQTRERIGHAVEIRMNLLKYLKKYTQEKRHVKNTRDCHDSKSVKGVRDVDYDPETGRRPPVSLSRQHCFSVLRGGIEQDGKIVDQTSKEDCTLICSLVGS